MECPLPTDSSAYVNGACPAPFRGALPRIAPLSLKLTFPVATPLPEEVTIAVKVIGTPKFEGLAEDTTVVDVCVWLTTCTRTGEVLLSKALLPPYTAVMLCVPTDNGIAGEHVACPPFKLKPHKTVGPSTRFTVPEGAPPGDVTV